jgi:hypothetical protein
MIDINTELFIPKASKKAITSSFGQPKQVPQDERKDARTFCHGWYPQFLWYVVQILILKI